jgi:CRP-like cAMP-binding protein
VNLGSLGPGDFFGELSLLPLRSAWRHSRTTTAVQNSLMYYLAKAKIEVLCKKYPDLKHALDEHAEDYEKMQSQGLAQAAAKDGFKK